MPLYCYVSIVLDFFLHYILFYCVTILCNKKDTTGSIVICCYASITILFAECLGPSCSIRLGRLGVSCFVVELSSMFCGCMYLYLSCRSACLLVPSLLTSSL